MSEWWSRQIKGITKSEELCTHICDTESQLIYVITRDKYNNYKLYSIKSCQATYTKHKANNPLKLEKFIDWKGNNE